MEPLEHELPLLRRGFFGLALSCGIVGVPSPLAAEGSITDHASGRPRPTVTFAEDNHAPTPGWTEPTPSMQPRPLPRLTFIHDDPTAVSVISEKVPETVTPQLEGPVWTIAAFEDLALRHNPTLARAAANLEAARASWLQAGLPPNPAVGYASEEIGDAGTAGLQGGIVIQRWVLGHKLARRRQVAARAIAEARQQWQVQRRRVLTDVKTAYYGVLIAGKKRDLTRDLKRIGQRALSTSQQLFLAGDISRLPVLQTEIQLRTAEVLMRQAENEQHAAWRRLAAVLGLPGIQPGPVEDGLDTIPVLDWESSLARLQSESPELASAAAAWRRARAVVVQQRAEVVPDVTTQITVQHNNVTGDTVTGVQATLPLPLWNRNQGNIGRALADVRAATADIQRVELDLQQRLAAAFQQYADAEIQVRNYAEGILPRAREAMNLVASGYASGEVGYLDLLTAQRTYFQTNLAYLEALQRLWQSSARIDGLLLGDNLQVPAQS